MIGILIIQKKFLVKARKKMGIFDENFGIFTRKLQNFNKNIRLNVLIDAAEKNITNFGLSNSVFEKVGGG